jgi:alpha-tubulin suppressor-like RCC1 family protein
VYTWGKNNSGELGLGDDQPRNQIMHVTALRKKVVRKVQRVLDR